MYGSNTVEPGPFLFIKREVLLATATLASETASGTLGPSDTPGSLTTTSSANGTATGTSTGGGYTSTSFVGNTPSTVLFFLALAVGVFIALLFIFFTVRYFVRAKYGLHIYSFSQRERAGGFGRGPGPRPGLGSRAAQIHGPLSMGRGSVSPTANAELREHMEFIRGHLYLRLQIMDHRVLVSGRRRRRRRRGRYSRMRKLSEQEVETLFPKKTYHDWLNGGQERDHEIRDGAVQEGDVPKAVPEVASEVVAGSSADEDASAPPATDTSDTGEMIELRNLQSIPIVEEVPTLPLSAPEPLNSVDSDTTSATESKIDDVLHFSSGSCAICLEVIEDEDVVRGLICGHVFHADCLDPWLTKRRACCPMCKRDYYTKDTNAEGEGTAAVDAQNAENDDQDDTISIDLETLRNDPALRAIFQELAPLQERVRMIVLDEGLSNLRIEESAQELADSKYSNVIKRIWWKLMGISKKDLFNWAVIHFYRARPQNPAAPTDPITTDQTSIDPTSTDPTSTDPTSTDPTSTDPIVTDSTPDLNISPGPTVSNNQSQNSLPEPTPEPNPEPISETARNIVEQRV